jgi:hypothetical protein
MKLMKTEIKFTHVASLEDIRKMSKNGTNGTQDISYMLKFKELPTLYLPAGIFDTAVEKYLLTKNFTRANVMDLKFSLVVTEGYYWKYSAYSKTYGKVNGYDNSSYLNFISVSSGLPLDQNSIYLDLDTVSV